MIGIIDSGMGGLTTLDMLLRHDCDDSFCYYADTANAPYGNKDKGRILRATFDAASRLVGYGAHTIVLGCNTATIASLGYLANKLPCPVYGVTPPIEEAVQAGGSVLVLATAFTGEYIRRVYGKIRIRTLPDLATLVDRYYPDEMAPILAYLEQSLQQEEGVDNLVLGCTHYLLLKEEICRITRAKRTFDANERLAKQLEKSPRNRGKCVNIVSSGAIDETRYTEVLEALSRK